MRAILHRQPRPVADLDLAATELREVMSLTACSFEPWPYDRQLPVLECGRVVLPADEPALEFAQRCGRALASRLEFEGSLA